jgi:hypothetical protein
VQPQDTSGGSGWFGDALNNAVASGADPSAFTQHLSQVADQLPDPSQVYGHALTAVANAGGDVSQFAQSFTPPSLPTTGQPSPSATSTPLSTDDINALFNQQGLPSASNPPPSPGGGAAPVSGPVDQSRPTSPIDNSSRDAFARSFAPYAAYISSKTGIDPTLVTAMAGSESNFGNAPGNELFGIKALPGQASQSLATHEGAGAASVNENQDFAAYGTPGDSADAYINLINKHYPGAVGAQNAADLAHGLKAGGYYTAAESDYRGILSNLQQQVAPGVNAALSGQQPSTTAGGVSDTSGLNLDWLGGGGGGGSAGGGMPAQGSGTATTPSTG